MPNHVDPHRTGSSPSLPFPHGWALVAVAATLLSAGSGAQSPESIEKRGERPAVAVALGPDGRLVYHRDERGNAVVDFSHAGYRGGGVPLPDVPVRVAVPRDGGRDEARIQAALDLVSEMAPDASGHRGAVLLEAGTYEVPVTLAVRASGVVLRGAGAGEGGTTIVATGTARRPLVLVEGTGTRALRDASTTAVTEAYVPAGARALTLASTAGLRVGDRVVIRRPSTREWVSLLGMNTFPGWRPENRLHWQPGSRDIAWDRRVAAIDGHRVTFDAPLTTALESALGGGEVAAYDFAGRLSEVGVEFLRLVSAYDPERPWDEDHAWEAISLDKVEDAWIRDVEVRHFAGFAVNVQADASRLTVQDVTALDPVSEVGGHRRRVFHTAGQQTLFNRCRSRLGKHDFSVGHAAPGPNVFLDSRADRALDWSGPLGSWSSGVLFDNVIVRGNAIRFMNRGVADQGSGWTTANSIIWNAEATDIEVHSPPGATNQAYGSKGVVSGDGIVYDPRSMPYRDFYRGMPVRPRSLYEAQLGERLGAAALDALRPAGPRATVASDVRHLAAADVDRWLAHRAAGDAPEVAPAPLSVRDGRFVVGDRPAWTKRTSYSWFQAQMPRVLAERAGPAITRFAPGLRGRGLTDDLRDVVASMERGGVFVQHYGLWYDRRRVDHNYYGSNEQRTGDVWAPFMELPWARSGQGKAWDGLSTYDLTRFNPWYFDRVKTFADLADREGRVLYYAFYFQHWLLESRSHYVDFPWRPVNTIQDTGLPDEVPAANVFYDLTSPVRRDLHQRYIRKVLDTLGPNTNVVFGIDREYTGSLAFVQFWLDEIAAWQEANGKRVFIALEVPKDQLDAILEDPVRGPMVTAIDFHGWLYRADGRLFAVRGGLDRAPREQRPDIATREELDALRSKIGDAAGLDQGDFLNGPEYQRLFDTLWKGSTPMHYRARREYRDRYPELVLLREGDEYPEVTRLVEALVPRAVRARMRPSDSVLSPRDSSWAMAAPEGDHVVYAMAGGPVRLNLAADAAGFEVQYVDAAAGVLVPGPRLTGGRGVTLTPPDALAGRPWVAWITRGVGGSADQGIGGSADAAMRAEATRAVVWNIDNLESIGGHPVRVLGTPRVVDTAGGRSVRFDGVDDGLFVESNPLAGLTRFTVEVEFLPDADGPPEQRFLHFEEATGGTRALIETRILPGGTWCLDTFLRDATASLPLIDRTKAHAAGVWHTAALTYDGTTMAHYVDGVKELEGAVKVKPQGPGRVSIGVRQNLVYWFKGQIRRVKITPAVVPPEKLLRVAP